MLKVAVQRRMAIKVQCIVAIVIKMERLHLQNNGGQNERESERELIEFGIPKVLTGCSLVIFIN